MSALSDAEEQDQVTRQWPAGTSQLVRELDLIRKVGAQRLTDQLHGIETLLSYSEELLPAIKHRGGAEQVRTLLRKAIALLTDATQRNAGLTVIGLTGKSGIDNESVGTREKAAAKEYRLSYHTFRGQRRNDLIRAIAREVESMVEAHRIETRWHEIFTPEVPVRFVRRTVLEREFLELLRRGAPVIVFSGLAGMGKSRIAMQLTEEYKPHGTRVIRLDAGERGTLLRGMSDALVESGFYPRESETLIEIQFREYLESEAAPRYVVVDDVHDAQLLSRIVTSKTRSTVVVTSRRRLARIPAVFQIEVGVLEDDEAVRLIFELRPGAPKRDVIRLADKLGNYPLAILAACGMLKATPTATIFGLCQNLESNATIVFDGGDDQGYCAVTPIYRQTIASLKSSDPQALLALELIVLLRGTCDVPLDMLKHCLGIALGLDVSPEDQREIVLQRCLRILQSFYLVTVDNGWVRIHRLAKAIIAGLLSHRQLELRDDLHKGIIDSCKAARELETDLGLVDFLNGDGVICAVHLAGIKYGDQQPFDDFERTIQMLRAATWELLDAIGESPDQVILAAFVEDFSVGRETYRVQFIKLEVGYSEIQAVAIVAEAREDKSALMIKAQPTLLSKNEKMLAVVTYSQIEPRMPRAIGILTSSTSGFLARSCG